MQLTSPKMIKFRGSLGRRWSNLWIGKALSDSLALINLYHFARTRQCLLIQPCTDLFSSNQWCLLRVPSFEYGPKILWYGHLQQRIITRGQTTETTALSIGLRPSAFGRLWTWYGFSVMDALVRVAGPGWSGACQYHLVLRSNLYKRGFEQKTILYPSSKGIFRRNLGGFMGFHKISPNLPSSFYQFLMAHHVHDLATAASMDVMHGEDAPSRLHLVCSLLPFLNYNLITWMPLL